MYLSPNQTSACHHMIFLFFNFFSEKTPSGRDRGGKITPKKICFERDGGEFFCHRRPFQNTKNACCETMLILKSRLSQDKISACRETILIFFLFCLFFVLQSRSLTAKD